MAPSGQSSIFVNHAPIRIVSLARFIVLTMALAAAHAACAQTYTVLHNFSGGSGGEYSSSSITLDAGGNLYGTTAAGGTGSCSNQAEQGCGTVFKLKHAGSGWILNTLYSFLGNGDGAYPNDGVFFGTDGALYGSTTVGGLPGCSGPGCGTVYRLTPPATFCPTVNCSWVKTMLYQFTGGNDGTDPTGQLVFDHSGNIYGTSASGGGNGEGTAYELARSGGNWAFNLLYSFNAQIANPYNVVLDSAGRLYGPAGGGANGWGVIYQLTSSGSGWTATSLYNFQNGNDGEAGLGGVIIDGSGNLYGTTDHGGAGNDGTAFKLTSSGGWNFSLLHGFSGGDGCGPAARPTMDAAGNLYGTTVCDGPYGFGTVFKLTFSNDGWSYSDLHDFTGGSDGGYPSGAVAVDANGNVYGTAVSGGASNYGVIFEIAR
jgi:uncharacterized repeat protein (TIGR03803 family)